MENTLPSGGETQITDSILVTIRTMLGYSDEYHPFDEEIKVFINMAIDYLRQIGPAISRQLIVTGEQQTWEDLLGSDRKLEMVKTYVWIKVRLLHDPPSNSFLVDALNKEASQLEWRINADTDSAFKEIV